MHGFPSGSSFPLQGVRTMLSNSWQGIVARLFPSSRRKSRTWANRRRQRGPVLERLEERLAPASTFYVDNTPTIVGPGADAFTPNGGDQTPVSNLTLGVNLFTTI